MAYAIAHLGGMLVEVSRVGFEHSFFVGMGVTLPQDVMTWLDRRESNYYIEENNNP